MLKYIGDFDKLKDYGFVDCDTKYIKWLGHEIYGIEIDDDYVSAKNMEELVKLDLPLSRVKRILRNSSIVVLEIEYGGNITCWDSTTYCPTMNQTYAFNTLYDLIKDGLVIKESEINE